jgi:hypothetical protein
MSYTINANLDYERNIYRIDVLNSNAEQIFGGMFKKFADMIRYLQREKNRRNIESEHFVIGEYTDAFYKMQKH